jgi:3-isopropylmalate/(R)-2-methylmalate dehydratase small subunit
VAAVIAPSFGGLYFRNAFNLGLLLLTCPQAAQLQTDTHLQFSAAERRITRDNGQTLPTDPVPDFLLDMVRMGGLLPQLKHRLNPSKENP